jgi:16S rRNA U516 pseudouridylate synthase RsuA-like enzyme
MCDQELKGDKSMLKLYKSYVVEVKVKIDEEDVRKSESTIQIYDFDNKILMIKLHLPGHEITQVEIEEGSLLLVLHDEYGSKFIELVEVSDS